MDNHEVLGYPSHSIPIFKSIHDFPENPRGDVSGFRCYRRFSFTSDGSVAGMVVIDVCGELRWADGVSCESAGAVVQPKVGEGWPAKIWMKNG